MTTTSHHHKWKYQNIALVILGLIIALLLARLPAFHTFLLQLGGFGYLGAFLAGMFFVSTFTVATSALILLTLAETLSPLELALIAGLGSVVGDLLIFRFIKDDLSTEIKYLYNHVDRKKHFQRLFHSKYFNWMLPVIGGIIIASPLPDEIGISLLGIAKMNTVKFVLLSYLLNSLGLFAIISTSIFIKP